jgi:biopolymer transport protein ExbB/TolQ
MGLFSTIADAFTSGGMWMWAILAAQIVATAIMADRIFALFILRRPGQRNIARQFEKEIKSGELTKALQRAEAGSLTPINKVAQAGIQAALDMGGREEIQARMDEVILAENQKLEVRIGYLGMLANVGTLLGLLGTIVGLISAFSSITNVDPVQKAAILTNGISVAMYTTAYGLIMAIPALILFSVLQNRANNLAEDLNQASLKVFNWLSFAQEPVAKKKTRGA